MLCCAVLCSAVIYLLMVSNGDHGGISMKKLRKKKRTMEGGKGKDEMKWGRGGGNREGE